MVALARSMVLTAPLAMVDHLRCSIAHAAMPAGIALPAMLTTFAAMSTPGRPRFQVSGLENYFGSKGSQGTFHRIINAIPPHDVYVEPFLGAGRIFRIKRPALVRSYGMELSSRVAAMWSGACPAGYQVEQADAFTRLPQLIAELIAAGTDPLRVVVYVDPPYLLHTRRRAVETYDHELTVEGHGQLVALLRSLPVRVLFSHLPCEFYATAFHDWHSFTFNNTTRHGLQLEQVWCNFQPSPELHEYTYVGSGFREREWIKRQYGIILRRVAELPPSARIALRAMLDARETSDEDQQP